VLADQRPEHLFHIGHDAVETEDTPLEDLLAAEREELSGGSGGALGDLLDEPEPVREPIV